MKLLPKSKFIGLALLTLTSYSYGADPTCKTCPPPRHGSGAQSFASGDSQDFNSSQISTASSVPPPTGYGTGESGWYSFATSQGLTSSTNSLNGTVTFQGLGGTGYVSTNSNGSDHFSNGSGTTISLPGGIASWDNYGTPTGYSSWNDFNNSPSLTPPSGYSTWAAWVEAQMPP